MPNDAKLGLVLGIGLVIVLGVVFFRRELSPEVSATGTPAAVTPVRAPGQRGQFRPAQAKVMSQGESTDSSASPEAP
jgi:hypothetical protein